MRLTLLYTLYNRFALVGLFKLGRRVWGGRREEGGGWKDVEVSRGRREMGLGGGMGNGGVLRIKEGDVSECLGR